MFITLYHIRSLHSIVVDNCQLIRVSQLIDRKVNTVLYVKTGRIYYGFAKS